MQTKMIPKYTTNAFQLTKPPTSLLAPENCQLKKHDKISFDQTNSISLTRSNKLCCFVVGKIRQISLVELFQGFVNSLVLIRSESFFPRQGHAIVSGSILNQFGIIT